MLDILMTEAGLTTVGYTGLGIAGALVAWGLQRIPNELIKEKVGSCMYALGVTITLGLGKWKITKGVWNKLVEPYVIDLLDNVVVNSLNKFVEGMRSDNA
jgi:hypothetical protein